MKKIIFLFLITFTFIFLTHSIHAAVINVTNCTSISSNNIYTFNTSINSTAQFCMGSGTLNNVVFDCQGWNFNYTGTSNNGEGFYAQLGTNVTIKNCMMGGFLKGVEFLAMNNSAIINSTIVCNNSIATSYSFINGGASHNNSIENSTFAQGYIGFRTGVATNSSNWFLNNVRFINESSNSVLIENVTSNWKFQNVSITSLDKNGCAELSSTDLAMQYNLTFLYPSFYGNHSCAGGIFQLNTMVNGIFYNGSFGTPTNPITKPRSGNDFVVTSLGGRNNNISSNYFWTYNASAIGVIQQNDRNFTDILIENNFVNSTIDASQYSIMFGRDGSVQVVNHNNGTIIGNIIQAPQPTWSVKHDVLVGETNGTVVTNNIVIGGYYGFVIKSNTYINMTNNTMWNQTNAGIYEKAGSYDTFFTNQYWQMLNGLSHILIGNDVSQGFNETNATFIGEMFHNNSLSGASVQIGSNSTANIINVSYTDPEKFSNSDNGVTFENTSIIRRYWYYQANVTNATTFAGINGASVALFNNTINAAPSQVFTGGTLHTNLTTDSNGLTPKIILRQYINNGTATISMDLYGVQTTATNYIENDSLFTIATQHNYFENIVLSLTPIQSSAQTNLGLFCTSVINGPSGFFSGILPVFAIMAIAIIVSILLIVAGVTTGKITLGQGGFMDSIVNKFNFPVVMGIILVLAIFAFVFLVIMGLLCS